MRQTGETVLKGRTPLNERERHLRKRESVEKVRQLRRRDSSKR